MSVLCRYFETFVFNNTYVGIGVGFETCEEGKVGTFYEDMVAFFLEEVDNDAEVGVEEVELDTEVLLVNARPHGLVAIRAVVPAAACAVAGPVVVEAAAVAVELGEVSEAAVRRVVTYDTVGVAYFEERDYVAQRAPPGFVRRYPAGCYCGEETEAVAFEEVFRTGITAVELNEVTAVEVVSGTEGETLLLVGQSVEEAAGLLASR